MVGAWNRADRINLFIALTAAVAALCALVPEVLQLRDYIFRPRVTIIAPLSHSTAASNLLTSKGIAKHIPESSDLWFVVRSGIEGRWYPVTRISLTSGGGWRVSDICTSPGPRDLEVFLVSDTDEAQLFMYLRQAHRLHFPGIDSMPPGSALQAISYVQIPPHARKAC